MTTGYRCHQELYDAAHELIQNNQLALTVSDKHVQSVLQTAVQHKLTSVKKSNKDTVIEFFQAESEVMELVFVVQKIQQLADSGVPLKEIAVLYRGNKEAAAIGDLLEKSGIEYELSAGTNALEDRLILQLLNFLAVMQQVSLATESELFFEVMQYDWVGLPKLGAYKLAAIAGKMRLSISDVLALEYARLTQTYELSEQDFAEFVGFKQRLLEWYQLSKNMLFHEWLSLVLSNTSVKGSAKGFGLIQYIVTQPIKTQHLLAFNTLFNMSKESVGSDRLFSLDDLLKKINIMKEHGVKLPVVAVTHTAQKVTLSTAHSAKGKEWAYVFVIGAVDKKWGNSIHKELLPLPESIITSVDVGTKEKNEDDRRLFYVAVTRASTKM